MVLLKGFRRFQEDKAAKNCFKINMRVAKEVLDSMIDMKILEIFDEANSDRGS